MSGTAEVAAGSEHIMSMSGHLRKMITETKYDLALKINVVSLSGKYSKSLERPSNLKISYKSANKSKFRASQPLNCYKH